MEALTRCSRFVAVRSGLRGEVGLFFSQYFQSKPNYFPPSGTINLIDVLHIKSEIRKGKFLYSAIFDLRDC